MPRRHVRKPGSRRYQDNPICNLMDAIDAVEEGMAVFRAHKIFGTGYNRSCRLPSGKDVVEGYNRTVEKGNQENAS